MDIRRSVLDALTLQAGLGAEPRGDALLGQDLGLDSLDVIEIGMEVEEQTGLEVDLPHEFGRDVDPTVDALVAAIEACTMSQRSAA